MLKEARAHVPAGQEDRVFPGMLLALGPDLIPSAALLRQWLAANREAGLVANAPISSTRITNGIRLSTGRASRAIVAR